MSRTTSRAIGVAALAAALAWPSAAGAQIYTWRDASGNIVVGNHRPSGLAAAAVRTYPVVGTTTIFSTREVARPVAGRFDDIIVKHANSHGVRVDLVRAVIQTESAFDPSARSSKGAMGLMQLMPDTAADYGVMNPYDPDENVRGGVAYLKNLLDRYDGNEELALAAYNAGPSTVDRYGQKVPPYRETRTYLKRIREATALTAISKVRIYRTVEIVGGREVPRYTNVKPAPDAREMAAARRR
jgi:soluble lytic murein transglycosylase-like protein